MNQIPKIKIDIKRTCTECKNNVNGSDTAYKRCKECLGSFNKIHFEVKDVKT